MPVAPLIHAHLDHSGYLPLTVKEGFTGTIYASSGGTGATSAYAGANQLLA